MRSVRASSLALAVVIILTTGVQVSARSELAPTPDSAAQFKVIASGLLNPRGLALSPGGRLFFAEAGVGDGETEGGAGPTGRIGAVLRPGTASPVVHTVRTGLISLGGPEGETLGVSGVSIDDRGRLWAIMNLSQLGTFPHPQIGRLLHIDRATGDWSSIANVGDRNYRWSNRHLELSDGFPDSNPYGLLTVGRRRYIADAGTNTLVIVGRDHKVKVAAYFPMGATSDATPTCVARGPDGALYVGTLSLVDSLFTGPPQPEAKIYRIDPARIDPGNLRRTLNVAKVWASGLWPVHSCAFGPGGRLWVSQIFTGAGDQGPTGGSLVSIPFGDPQDLGRRRTFGEGVLAYPAGVAVEDDGTVYVVNGSITTDGQILRLER